MGVSLLSSRTPIRLGKAQIFVVLENGIFLSVLLRVFSETFATVKNPPWLYGSLVQGVYAV